MTITYVALVHKANKKSADYGVIFPDFPGSVSGGKTLDQALENARDGLLFHIEGMLDAGELIPEPSSLEKIKKNKKYKECMPSLIRVTIPKGKSKRLNISLDVGLIAEIDHAALLMSKNRSEFLAVAARQLIA